jgi:hypothetical protein
MSMEKQQILVLVFRGTWLFSVLATLKFKQTNTFGDTKLPNFQSDFWRNFGSCVTERLRIKPEWSFYLIDLRIGFQRQGKWRIGYISIFQPVTQNFWNGIFTLNVYVVKTTLWGIPLLFPRIGTVIRFSHNRWFEAGIGYLFDRGEFGGKLVFMEWNAEEKWNPNCNAVGWEEGPV